MKDWTGNANSKNCNVRSANAEENDYYATEPRAVEMLLGLESFNKNIWEPACGEGHISRVLEEYGHTVVSTDLIDRGFGKGGQDFLKNPYFTSFNGDIITNPPYRYATEFVRKALDIAEPGNKVAMFLKLTFLEGQKRRSLFRDFPPHTVYVSSARLRCGKGGIFKGQSMTAYAWYVWQKGYPRPNLYQMV